MREKKEEDEEEEVEKRASPMIDRFDNFSCLPPLFFPTLK